jgi:hypothetical protein
MLAAACYAVKDHLIFHNENDGPFKKYRFFGLDSWKRKYKRAPSRQGIVSAYDLYPAPDNWYYNTFKIDHEEKFPWSATALVFVTDGVHLFQWLFIKFILLALTLAYDNGFHFDWKWFLILWIGWSLSFSLVFARLKK